MSTVDVQLSFSRARSIVGGATGSLPYQTATSSTVFAPIGSNGTILQSNGTTATWVAASGIGAGTATNADAIRTIERNTSAAHFLTFVDSNNASNAYESLYTTSSFTINPATGNIGIRTAAPLANFQVGVSSALSNYQGSAVGIMLPTGTGSWLELAENTVNGTSFRISKDVSTGVVINTNVKDLAFRAGGYETTVAGAQLILKTTGNVFIGNNSELNPGFTNRLNVNGSIVAGSAVSTNGSIILQGQYGTGSITNFGTEFSSGGPVLSYGAYPSSAAAGAFFSSSGLSLTRAAYTQNGHIHQWYVGGVQTVAIGSALTMTNPMTLNASGLQTLSLGIGTAPSGTTGEIRATNEITAYFSSDIRLKENIKVIEDPISIVNQIRGVRFDWTDAHIIKRGGEDGYFVRKHDIGVIAQEVEAVLPELVAERDDGTKVVKYEKLVALLIEAVKDQQQQINQLSDLVNTLVVK